MSYFRYGYRSFEEFQREAFIDGPELGKEELELLRELEMEDDPFKEPPHRRMSRWD